MNKEFQAAINQICDEKGIDRKTVLETVEAAIAAAYRKDYGHPDQNIKAKYNEETGDFEIFDAKEVVADEEEAPDLRKQITLNEAKKIRKKIKVGDEIKTKIEPPGDYGRVAAQTAKQVIIQRIREAERNALFDSFKKREGELVNGVIQRIEGSTLFVDLGQATGFIPPSEQVRSEHYQINQRLKVYIKEVREGSKGPEIVLSRIHPEIIHILFSLEVPEINAGTVEVKRIAREPGSRSKIAVASTDPEVDPIGACVGQRGSRVQAVINEINGEKIDIVEWNDDPVKFISNALAPAKVVMVTLVEKEKTAKVAVDPEQLSLAIGKEGQNVRLAAKLTDWKIDVKAASAILETQAAPAGSEEAAPSPKDAAPPRVPKTAKIKKKAKKTAQETKPKKKEAGAKKKK